MIRYGALLLLAILLFAPVGGGSGDGGSGASASHLAISDVVGDGLFVLPTPTEIHRHPGVGYLDGRDSPKVPGTSRNQRHRS